MKCTSLKKVTFSEHTCIMSEKAYVDGYGKFYACQSRKKVCKYMRALGVKLKGSIKRNT